MPTAKRTYGYGRTSILAALANAVLLLVAIGAIGWEAIQRFRSPQPVEGMTVMIVAAVGILVNGGTALLFMRGRKGDINIRGAFLHMASDAGISAGVVVAGLVMILTGWLWLDPLVSLLLVAVVAVGTWGLLKDSVALAIDAVPAGIARDAVFDHLQALDGVSDVHDLHIWPLSTTSTALTVHLVCEGDRIDDGLPARIVEELRHRFKIDHATIQFETGRLDCGLEPDHVVYWAALAPVVASGRIPSAGRFARYSAPQQPDREALVTSDAAKAKPNLESGGPMTEFVVRAATMAAALLLCGPCLAAETTTGDPEITLSARETVDTWRNLSGGLAVGWTTLNKLQVSATWTANALDDPGFRIHAQVFRTNGERLTSHTGDLQTVSNIEAVSTDRLFEAWAEQTFGKDGHGGWAVRAGLIDFNSDFDSIDPASLFIDSSHGIGPDISKSGRNGPSIFPVSAAAVRLTWTPTESWTVRGGVFDGVPGNPDHPKAFAAVRLNADDGMLSVLQVDRKLSKDAQVSVGAWGYNRGVPRLDGAGPRADAGVYGFVEGPVPRLDGWTGWVRVGRGDPTVQVVYGYLGAGLVKKGTFAARPDDRLGFAVANAVISPTARRLNGLSHDETTFEGTYQIKVRDWIAVQPDVQYIVHPSTQAHLGNALVVGVRLVFTAGYPRRAPATEQTDPTVAPDAPPDAPPGASNKPPSS